MSCRTLLLLNFNANTVNALYAYADLSTCKIFALPLAFRREASWGCLEALRRKQRAMLRGTARRCTAPHPLPTNL